MELVQNPVLQRELLVNLRTWRAVFLLAVYQILLAGVVLLAWPADERLDLSSNPTSAKKLVDLFFLGQYVLASLMAPSFAAGAITGEKERKTYEMLLASPLRPGAIIAGKMVACLTHLGILIAASLPIIVLCLPLGGVSVYEVLAAYLGLIVSVIVFGAIGVACSSYFQRTVASVMVSYLIVLPMVMLGALFWRSLEAEGELRLKLSVTVIPAYGLAATVILCVNAAARMLYPPDVGSEGNEVVDLDKEAEQAIGLVIQRDQFPDKLFAPPKRRELMQDGANPVYDKEIHSEVFSQGTLMLRLVIQISMLLAIPLMAWLLFSQPILVPYYISYVLVFNILVAPVFSSGSITSERERQTLDLLLTTMITPAQILLGKLIVSLRVSGVLTAFLMFPPLLAMLMLDSYWTNWDSMVAYFAIIALTCVMDSVIALFCSVCFRRTSISQMVSYMLILLLFAAPVALMQLLRILDLHSSLEWAQWTQVFSPFAAAFAVPLDRQMLATATDMANSGNLYLLTSYFAGTASLIIVLLALMVFLFERRWWIGQS
jgi:ABC-type transport system involved in multi-copper enzyme maturation permease subunit